MGKIDKKIIKSLREGKVGVLPTDTIYGLVGSALNKKAVERIYELKKRNPKKPCPILIAKTSDLEIFKIKPNQFQKKLIAKFWPGKFSLVFSCPQKKLDYLHRGKKSLALRLPASGWLRKLIEKTGPLIAPSANPESSPPAKTIREAKRYFEKKADFYLDFGKIDSKPSTLIDIRKKKIKILRP